MSVYYVISGQSLRVGRLSGAEMGSGRLNHINVENDYLSDVVKGDCNSSDCRSLILQSILWLEGGVASVTSPSAVFDGWKSFVTERSTAPLPPPLLMGCKGARF